MFTININNIFGYILYYNIVKIMASIYIHFSILYKDSEIHILILYLLTLN